MEVKAQKKWKWEKHHASSTRIDRTGKEEKRQHLTKMATPFFMSTGDQLMSGPGRNILCLCKCVSWFQNCIFCLSYRRPDEEK